MKGIKAISFDLDDTLYDNTPVIEKAYRSLFKYLVDHYPKISGHYDFDSFISSAIEVRNLHQQLVDLEQIRLRHIRHILQISGYQSDDVKEQLAFQIFWLARQEITLDDEVLNTLKQLSNIMPLIVISNGNACIKHIGIAEYFQFSLNPTHTGKAKPDSSLFLLACEKLNIKPEQLLHIGDSLETDVEAANNAGCSSVWFNSNKKPESNLSEIAADIEIKQIKELLNLFSI